MSNISAFLIPNASSITKKVIISNRFKDKDGEVQAFTIKSLSQEENEIIRKRASLPINKNGVIVGDKLDTIRYGRELVVASVVEPDFRDTKLCDFYKTMDPLEVPGKMLLAGEYNRLISAINDLNGFNDDEYKILEEEAKNS